MDLAALILAGGQGNRMDGRDKGLVEYRGAKMIDWTRSVLVDKTEQLIISCNRNLTDYLPLADTVVCDRISGYLGPLAGVHAAMEATSAKALLVLPCDTPQINAELIDCLIESSQQYPGEIVYFSARGQAHPLHAVIPCSLKESLADYLIEGGRAVRRWYAQHAFREIELNESQSQLLMNINFTSELAG